MARGRGKGKVSNDLVAASCAAVLSVYGAGYWRTRDEARRFDMRTQERRPARPETPPAITDKPAVFVAPTHTVPPPETPRTISSPVVAALPPATAIAEKASSIDAAAAPSIVASSQATPAPGIETGVAAIAVTSAAPPDSAAAPTSDTPPELGAIWRDGTYTGWGTSRHGDIKARVVIKDGRIVASSIDSCETRYPCDVIEHIINQPVARQSAEVDRVSRATESADAYYFGVLSALNDALVQPPEAISPK